MRLKKILAGCALMATALSASAGTVTIGFEECELGFQLGICSEATQAAGLKLSVTGAVQVPGGWANVPSFSAFTVSSDSASFEHLDDPTNLIAMSFGNFDENGFPIGVGEVGQLKIMLDKSFSSFSMLYTIIGSWGGNGVTLLDKNGNAFGASQALPDPHPADPPCTGADIACTWAPVSLTTAGTGKEAWGILIETAQHRYAFDDLTFNVNDNGTVPEPTGTALALAALGALAFTRRRRSR